MEGLILVVDNILVLHESLLSRGVEVSEVQEFDRSSGTYRPLAHDPDWNAFVFFDDPDGNSWVVQQRGN